jgi:5-methyltetrahydrofolate--homocysteine methyltransferase
MVDMAKEMERAGFDVPLLIGGATTSRVHTAVKIDEKYNLGQAVHVLDASRAVTVVSNLLGDKKTKFVEDLQQEYVDLREMHAKKQAQKNYLNLAQARERKFKIDWKQDDISTPNQLGLKTFSDYSMEDITEYIDWTPFFQTWELAGRFPRILEDEVVGKEATDLYNDALKMLQQIIDEKWLTANAVVGLWPANSVNDDDIEIYTDETRSEVLSVQHGMRQQLQKAPSAFNMCLSDFIAPKESGIKDYIGGFVVTAGLGIEPHIERFEADHDDYNSILLKALADRLAEAFAELMHAEVRKNHWGYAPEEVLQNDELIKEK